LNQLAEAGDVRAAWALSFIVPNQDTLTRVVIRTIQTRSNLPSADSELYWLRNDPELNRQIVPLLTQLLGDPRAPEEARKSAAIQLGYRGVQALSALLHIQKAAMENRSTALPGK